jgi:hypothetical protein
MQERREWVCLWIKRRHCFEIGKAVQRLLHSANAAPSLVWSKSAVANITAKDHAIVQAIYHSCAAVSIYVLVLFILHHSHQDSL